MKLKRIENCKQNLLPDRYSKKILVIPGARTFYKYTPHRPVMTKKAIHFDSVRIQVVKKTARAEVDIFSINSPTIPATCADLGATRHSIFPSQIRRGIVHGQKHIL